MIILAGSFRVAPGGLAVARPLIEAMVAATRAEAGCLTYTMAFDLLDDHLVRVFEVFEDEAALEAHRQSQHMAQWRASWSAGGLTGRDMARYDVSGWRKI